MSKQQVFTSVGSISRNNDLHSSSSSSEGLNLLFSCDVVIRIRQEFVFILTPQMVCDCLILFVLSKDILNERQIY